MSRVGLCGSRGCGCGAGGVGSKKSGPEEEEATTVPERRAEGDAPGFADENASEEVFSVEMLRNEFLNLD